MYEAISNKARISGILETEFIYSHTTHEVNLYRSRVIVTRTSGTEDYVPIIIKENMIPKENSAGKYIIVTGTLRSAYVTGDDNHYHLEMYVFSNEFCFVEEAYRPKQDINSIYLDGTLCNIPVCRETPFGRTVTDVKLLVEREYRKKDIFPCIAWGNYAERISELSKEDRIQLQGRFQSRIYFKRETPEIDDVGEYKTTYEISIMKAKWDANQESIEMKEEEHA